MMEKVRIQPRIRSRLCHMQGREAGFSLIEMVVVIGIAAILLSIAAGAWGALREKTRVDSAKETVVSVLQQMRLRALSTGVNQVVTLDWTNDTVSYTTSSTYTSSLAPVDIQGFKCTGAVLKPAGTDTFTFTPRGKVQFSDSNAQNLRVMKTGVTKMFTIKVNDVTGRIAVVAGGAC
ncbi:MAG: Tfp pilus assembly protein FimT/FimU [Mariprofundaceae bacterium]